MSKLSARFNVTDILFGLLTLLTLLLASAAQATVVTGTFEGVVPPDVPGSGSMSYDYTGVFGTPGSLVGRRVTGTFRYDTSKFGAVGACVDPVCIYSEYDNPGAVSITQTINGISVSFNDSYYGSMQAIRDTAPFGTIFYPTARSSTRGASLFISSKSAVLPINGFVQKFSYSPAGADVTQGGGEVFEAGRQAQYAFKITRIAATSGSISPDTNFSFSPASPNVGQEVQFTATSTGAPTSWSWNFGDGLTATMQNPRHTFASSGSFLVTLTVSNASGSRAKSKTVTVTASPVANFQWSPTAPKQNEQVGFTDISTGNPTSWSWDFGDDTNKSTSRNPKHTYSKSGTYRIALTVSNAAGSNSASKNVVVGSNCPVNPLPPPPFPDWETGTPPDYSLRSPAVDVTLDAAVSDLIDTLRRENGLTLSRTSGYRPMEYQRHFFSFREWFDDLVEQKRLLPDIETRCAEVIAELNREIAVHKIVRNGSQDSLGGVKGAPLVNPPAVSSHTATPALALDLGPKELLRLHLGTVDRKADQKGLSRACGDADIVHFQKKGSPCDRPLTVRGTANSPVAILLTAADGRRVGFDPASGTIVNEFGEAGYYSGSDSEPQEVIVSGLSEGVYTLSGVGLGSGAYVLQLHVYPSSSDGTDPDDVIAQTTISGVTAPKETLTPLVVVAPKAEPPGPSRRRSARH